MDTSEPKNPVYDKPEVVKSIIQHSKGNGTDHANERKPEVIYSFSNTQGMAFHNLNPEQRARIIHSNTNPNGTVSPFTGGQNTEITYSYTNVGKKSYETNTIEKPTEVNRGREDLTDKLHTAVGKSTYHENRRSSKAFLKEDLKEVGVGSLEGGTTSEASSTGIGLTEEQFSGIYHDNLPSLVNYLVKRFGASIEDAEDSSQEALVKGWKSYSRFEGRSTISTWLTTIARNEYLMLLRKRKSRVDSNTVPLEDYDSAYTQDHSQATDSKLLQEESMKRIDEGLTDNQREVFEMIKEGYSIGEIPNILNIKLPAAKNRLHQARKKAKGIIKKQLGISVQDLF